MRYGRDHAELYEAVFRDRGKDFDAEARGLAGLIRARFPTARTLLDVACGTGAHLATLRTLFDEVEGLELSVAMRDVARRRLPGASIHAGDMRGFELHRRFDAVTCVGSAIAEVDSHDELVAAVGRMAAHLACGGVLLVEPWYFPDGFLDGYAGGHLFHDGGRFVSRLTHSRREGLRSRVEIRYSTVDSAGFSEFSELITKILFRREQYEEAFERAGLSVELVPGFALANGRPNGPGLFVGTRGAPA
ncbi:hypothetical protein GCM10029978_055390 [Actinoallomurus acanthiterrae]